MKLLIVLYIPFLQKLLFRGLIDKRESYIEIEKIEKVYGLYVDTKPKKILRTMISRNQSGLKVRLFGNGENRDNPICSFTPPLIDITSMKSRI